MNGSRHRFEVLDGWRGISILLVLITHLLPVGPKFLQLNVACGILGMALFFNLSGFLITHFLLEKPAIFEFLVRRFFRIVPLAWLYLAFSLTLYAAPDEAWLPHFLFYANLPPKPLISVTDHFWSICVEVQFYVGIALLVALFKRRGLMLLPALCVAATLFRMANGIHYSVFTYFRIDEILSGSILALAYNGRLGSWLPKLLSKDKLVLPVFAALLVSSHVDGGFVTYLRPYLAMALIGFSLYNRESWLAAGLRDNTLAYIASISYALYVLHPLLASTWLGSGDLIEKYSKRPLLFLCLFGLAHLSTFYFERYWIAFGRMLAERRRSRTALGGVQPTEEG